MNTPLGEIEFTEGNHLRSLQVVGAGVLTVQSWALHLYGLHEGPSMMRVEIQCSSFDTFSLSTRNQRYAPMMLWFLKLKRSRRS